jgi:hypothetical protein
MLKPVKFIKNLERFWQQIFNLLPIISLGGTAFILGTFALTPNFMNFAHAEEGTNPPAPGETTLSVSVENDFYKFNDVYLTSDGVEQDERVPIVIRPRVETNNPAGYRVYFSDTDENTSLRSVDPAITDTIRSATPADFEDGKPKNQTDNYWYCGVIMGLNEWVSPQTPISSASSNNNQSIPTQAVPKLIDDVKYPNLRSSNGVYCNITINKQLTPSTYRNKMIFSVVGNTQNLKPAVLTKDAMKKVLDKLNGNNYVYERFDFQENSLINHPDFSRYYGKINGIHSSIESDYRYNTIPIPACPETGESVRYLNAITAMDMEPILIWTESCESWDYSYSLHWWTPSGKLSLGEDCSGIFSSSYAPAIKKIYLHNIDTSHCKNMESMFERNDNHLEQILFGDNKFSPELANTKKMFKGNSGLKVIYFKNEIDITNVADSSEMFAGDSSLKGYSECVPFEYNSSKIDSTFAKTQNGYFTLGDGSHQVCPLVGP